MHIPVVIYEETRTLYLLSGVELYGNIHILINTSMIVGYVRELS